MRSVRVLVVLLVGIAGVLLVGVGDAAAVPSIPGIPDCKTAPTPEVPGLGVADALDAPPSPAPPAADPFASQRQTSLYDQYGYAGLVWNTYDLGCIEGPGTFTTKIDTGLGNMLLGTATTLTAAANGLHQTVSHPGAFMRPLDDIVASVTSVMRRAIWSPWGAVALLGLVASLLFASASGHVNRVASSAAWALLVLGVLAGVTAYPTRVASYFDSGITSAIGSVNGAAAELSGQAVKGDPARAQGALLVDKVLYTGWLRGEFGSPDSPAARRWGPDLFKASTLTWSEAGRAAKSPDEAKAISEAKADQWKQTADKIADADPSAYAHVKGEAGGRTGSAFLTLVATGSTALFRFVADLFQLAALVVLRMLVMFFPVVAVPGVISSFSGLVRRSANMAGAAIVNVVAFGSGAVVHTTAVSAIIGHSDGAAASLLSVMLCLVLTLAACVMLWPLMSFSSILGGARSGSGRRAVSGLGRGAVRFATTWAGARSGVAEGIRESADADGEVVSREPRPYRDVERHDLPPESFGRRSEHPPIAEDERSLAPAGVDERHQLPPSGAPHGLHTEDPNASAAGTGPTTQRGGVLKGRVVTSLPDDIRVYRTHPANEEIRSDGVGARIYDPAVDATVPFDDAEEREAS